MMAEEIQRNGLSDQIDMEGGHCDRQKGKKDDTKILCLSRKGRESNFIQMRKTKSSIQVDSKIKSSILDVKSLRFL